MEQQKILEVLVYCVLGMASFSIFLLGFLFWIGKRTINRWDTAIEKIQTISIICPTQHSEIKTSLSNQQKTLHEHGNLLTIHTTEIEVLKSKQPKTRRKS